jgi:hypothetical protein
MAFNWDLRVPYQYSNRYITLRELEQIMLRSYHPEYVRRFIGWLHYKNGNVGAGGLSRTEQPTGPTFAPSLYVSFHWAGQRYNDGITAACAVDTVYKDGPDAGDAHDGIAWREVPIQGTAEAAKWGIHANVGVPGDGESWHLQPVEIDGHASWVAAGRPAPVRGYPIPTEHDPYYQAPPPPITPPPTAQENNDMIRIDLNPGTPKWTSMVIGATTITHTVNGNHAAVLERAGTAQENVTKTELLGILMSLRATNASPFAPGKPAADADLHAAWLTAATRKL